MGEELERGDAEAILAARRELGLSYEKELVENFAERIERAVDAQVAQRTGGLDQVRRDAAAAGKRQLTLGIVSLGTGIPITAVAGGVADLPGVTVAWLGIVGVNLAHAWQNRKPR